MSRALATLRFDPARASSAVKALRQRGFRRSAVVSKSGDGKLDTWSVGLTRRQSAIISLAASLATFAALAAAWSSAGDRLQTPAVAASCLGVLLWGVLRQRYPRPDRRLTNEVGKWLTPNESCLIVESARGAERELESLLHQLSRSRVFAVDLLLRSEQPAMEQSRPRRLSAKGLMETAADLAAGHRPLAADSRGQRLRHRLHLAAERHERARAALAEAVRRSPAESDVADWLLDNAHIVRSHTADIRRNLPSAYYKFLPRVDEDGEPLLRVYALARQLVASTDGRATVESITRCLDAYEATAPLLIAELWVFPLMVRMVLVETIAALAERVLYGHRLLEAADFLADRQLAAARSEGADASQVLDSIARRHPALEPCLIARLGEHLSDDAASTSLLEQWLEERFGTTFPAVVNQYHAAEGALRISVSNAIGSLRVLSEVDFSEVFERVSKVDEALRQDPAGVYTRSSFDTRDRCRRAVELAARYSTYSEVETAQVALDAARAGEASAHDRKRHVGYYLLDEGVAQLEQRIRCRPPWARRIRRWVARHATAVYLTGISASSALILTGCAAAAYALGWTSPWLLAAISALASFSAVELSIHIVHSLVIVLLRPRRLPQMDYANGIPDDCRTLVAVPMMLSSPEVIQRQAEQLEVHYLSTRDSNVSFALLADVEDADAAVSEHDQALLSVAREAIEALNERWGSRSFALFCRRRQWSESEQRWIGWERKRGKLEELNRFLVGAAAGPGPELVAAGQAPAGVRYVITLDSDTQLPTGSARSLVETISHPLNRIELTDDGRNRLRGYGIIQPRVSVALPGATATRFTRLFTDTTGTDPYCQAVSDVYQDLFQEASYHGKAIYDVRAFHAILDQRFPDQTLLSHDLIEGAHVGVGLASHIELFEKFPETYESYVRREHRWTRGDWQIADWATPRIPTRSGGRAPSVLSAINRWKIFDNLRRSLTAPASTALLLVCWLAPFAPAVYSLLVTFAMLTPTLSNVAQRVSLLESVRPGFRRLLRKDLARALADIALLPHRAYVLGDAIVRVWFRRLVSHRNLLEWQTSDAARRLPAGLRAATFLQTVIVSASSAGLLALLLTVARSQIAAPFLALWMASPLILRWLAQEERDPGAVALSGADRLELRKMARRTWRYFDDLVSPEGNWLPPDNVQEEPRYELAMRTSPTNIGLWLMAALSARDFGYLTSDELLERARSTYDALNKLERCEGHFLNWYHIDSLQPIEPRYVSSVDSGNFVASCWLFVAGIRELARAPLLTPACLEGLNDTLRIVREEVTRLGAGAKAVRALEVVLDLESERAHDVVESLRLAQAPIARLGAVLQWSHPDAASAEAVYWIKQLQRQIAAHVRLANERLDWMTLLEAPPDSFLLPLGKDAPELRESALATAPSLEALARGQVCGLSELLERGDRLQQPPAALSDWLDRVRREVAEASRKAARALECVDTLADGLTRLADETNFRFLYDDKRGLFAIGYRPGEPQEFSSHYDLLASEARLMSFVAIAKGDAPVQHWWHLGRPYGRGGDVLLSWNGSLFEYLMPPLFNVSFQGSLLDNACRSAIRAQIEHGARGNVPWGVSESAHSGLDAHQIYQYRAFGAPALGMKRGLEEDLVVAPYATMMALQFAPDKALRNLMALKAQGLYSRMGFFESIDYSRPARRGGTAGVRIHAYMAHHHGMSLMGLNNALHGGILQRRFHADPRARAIESLLFERIPASPPRIFNPAAHDAPRIAEPEAPVAHTLEPQSPPAGRVRAHALGHESFSVVLTGAGGGHARWRDLDVTRRRWTPPAMTGASSSAA